MSDTIFALSSGAPPAGVAILRISGPSAFAAGERLGGPLPAARRAALRHLVDASTGASIDEGLVLAFPKPASFTGEDVVELHVHGGRAVVAAVLAALGRMEGLRLAEPGEFTRRAFLAGRLDLTEVEGLSDLIAAETEEQRRQALRQARGETRRAVEGWMSTLLHARARIEAELDFSDEESVAGAFSAGVRAEIDVVRGALNEALRGGGERVRDGFTVIILGAPNAGKSSLLNALARRDAAIVAAEPGTTRDLVEVDIALDGLAVRLVDTAGIRDGAGPVEAEGIRRARTRAASSDLALWLWADPAWAGPDPSAVDGPPTLIVATKCDLIDSEAERIRDASDHRISVVTGAGLDGLLAHVAARLAASAGPAESRLVTRERHRRAMGDALSALNAAAAVPLPSGEIVAEHLRQATDALGRITGTVDVEDVLDLVFREFCIGK